jgi:two-component system, NtrC family, sensor kinase
MSPISTQSLSQRRRTLLITAVGLSLVLLLGLWDAHHDDVKALRQLMHEHYLFAATLSTYIDVNGSASSRELVSPIDEHHTSALTGVDSASARVERDQGFIVLLVNAARGQYLPSRHHWVQVPELTAALAHGDRGAILSRESAALLGLPRRTAVAGLSTIQSPSQDYAAVAVVTSAEAERDRSRREQWRSVLGIALASGLILVAGLGALRMQRRELELEQQRALNKLDRARHAELARANRMATIAALSSGIAHEISTPLGVIAGRIEQLQIALKGQERFERSADTIAAQVQRIDKVIRGFLAFARGDAPLLIHRAANEIARAAVQLVEYRFAIADVTLELKACTNASLQVACEPALFEQALVDILINALEASKAKQSVQLSVEYDDTSVYFMVLDEGTGISDSVIARVTDPFFTTKSRTGGSGLGLAIANEILIHHRGTLAFDLRKTTEGAMQAGTKVTVQLPRSEEVSVESS